MTNRKVFATIRKYQDSESVLWTVFQDGSFERGNEYLEWRRKKIIEEKGFLCDKDKEKTAEQEHIQEEWGRYVIKSFFESADSRTFSMVLSGLDTNYSDALIMVCLLTKQSPPFDEKYGDDEDDDISEDDPRFGKQKFFVEIFVDNPWQKWSEDDERWRILH